MRDVSDRIPGLQFAILEAEAVRRIGVGLRYNEAYLAGIDAVLITLRADLARGGWPSTSVLMGAQDGRAEPNDTRVGDDRRGGAE